MCRVPVPWASGNTAVLVAALAGLAPTCAPAQTNGVAETEVTFGISAAFSGPLKDYGQQMRVGIETAFAAQNAAGGVHGRRLRLVAEDDGYEPERTRSAMRSLLEKQKVFAVVGNVGTATAAVAVPYALEKGVVFFGAFTGADLLRNDPPDRFVFNYRASYWEETAALVRYLVEVRRVKPVQIAVLAQEDAFGDAGFEGIAFMMRKYRIDPSKVLRVGYKRNTTEVTEAVRAVKLNAPRLRAVVMVAACKPAVRFVQKLRSEGVDLVLGTISAVGASELSEQLLQLGSRFADGILVSQVVPLPTSKASAILKYQQDLARHASAEKPDFVSLEGYLAANLLIEGMQRAGRGLTTDSLIAALESIKGLDMGIGSPLAFGPSEHQASHKVWLTALDAQGAYRALPFQ
jgi:branched-chain amino acid transport system substrate-binding protein